MLHFNAPPAAALKPAAVAAEEDVYKVLILDRITKVGQLVDWKVAVCSIEKERCRESQCLLIAQALAGWCLLALLQQRSAAGWLAR